jgi:drug/metabolite transporter (DMT)-like permease
MHWVILSLLTALATASQDAWVKKFFSNFSPYEMSMYPLMYSCPLFLISMFWVPVPPLDATFYWCCLLSLPVNGISVILYMKAIKSSPLSLTLPYLAFTPAFMILTGYLFLGEIPNIWGVLGILITCLGSYGLNLEARKKNLLAPLQAVFKETGSWLMLIVSFLFSFAAVLGKKAILHSSVVFFTFSFFLSLNIFLFILLRMLGKIRLKTFKNLPAKGFIAGCLLFFHALFHGWAISITKAAYMISIKRFSVLCGIIYGGVFFKEKNIVIRFCSAIFMLCGAVLITIKGR